ncbi:MAG: PilW family protein [bacterium]
MSAQRGTTLIELVATLAIAALITSSLYLVLETGIKGRLIAQARITDQEWGRQALALLVDRVRQVNYDPQAPCPDSVLRIGTGAGFDQRLAFRAIFDAQLTPPRRTYVYYVQDRRLWQETLEQESREACDDEELRTSPDARRVALSPPVIERIEFIPLDRDGELASAPSRVRSIRITLTVQAPSTPGRAESQTYQTVVAVRGP